MAPNHPSSPPHPSTRKLHGFFEYSGNGRFQLKEPSSEPAEIESIDEIIVAAEDVEAVISLERDLACIHVIVTGRLYSNMKYGAPCSIQAIIEEVLS